MRVTIHQHSQVAATSSLFDPATIPTTTASSDPLSAPPKKVASVKPILKQRLSLPSYINNKRTSWKVLPAVNLEAVFDTASTKAGSSVGEDTEDEAQLPRPRVIEETLNLASGSRRRVTFDAIEIRCYEQTIGDNPSVSYGPPISLDWDYLQLDAVQLDLYEDMRPPRRTLRQMVLSYYHRRNVLTWQYGYTEDELREAKRQANKIKANRAATKALLPAMVFESAVENIRHKCNLATLCCKDDGAVMTIVAE